MAARADSTFDSLEFSVDVMPVLFVGHGSPMNAIEDNNFSRAWQALGERLPKPRAILSVSAHWLTRGTGITAMDAPPTIHDFWGFPRRLHEYHYPAPGDPALARTIAGAITTVPVIPDDHWGLDHGTWLVLANMYPAADIPVLQLSIDQTRPTSFHYALGKELAALRDDGVLVMGSGNIVHNLGRADPAASGAAPWATAFDAKVAELLEAGDDEHLIEYEGLGEIARMSVPTNDHYLPLMYVIGARLPEDRLTFFSTDIVFGTVSMRCAIFH